MVAIADIGLRERSFDMLGLMGLEILESPEFIFEWNAFVEHTGKFFINVMPDKLSVITQQYGDECFQCYFGTRHQI